MAQAVRIPPAPSPRSESPARTPATNCLDILYYARFFEKRGRTAVMDERKLILNAFAICL
jgi:hypothetical protein